MDPKFVYWTLASLNMAVLVALGWLGVAAIRRSEVARHRRRMLGAVALVGLFLVSYLGKLAFLGREQLALWEPTYVWVLRFHEVCVGLMLLAMGTAVFQALALGLPLGASDPRSEKALSGVRLHRRAGWTAVLAATLGVLSAGVVLYGMYQRLPASTLGL